MLYADSHADLYYTVAVNGADIFSGENIQHFTYEAMRKANQRLQLCSLWTPAKLSGMAARDFCVSMLDALDRDVKRRPEALEKVTDPWRLRQLCADADAPIALVPWIEGGSPLMGEIETFHQFADRGVKGIGLTWNHGNEIADGCAVANPRRGLTAFGYELLEAMESRRVLVDTAHLPEPAFWDLAERATRPFVLTHGGLRWIVDLTRNPSASMARAVANSGGFVGIDFYPAHLDPNAFKPGARQTTLDDLAFVLKEAIRACGEDNVVLGGDFDGFGDPIAGLTGVWDVPNLIPALERGGLPSRQIEKIVGRNLIERLFDLW